MAHLKHNIISQLYLKLKKNLPFNLVILVMYPKKIKTFMHIHK